jgi:hypothetical protein
MGRAQHAAASTRLPDFVEPMQAKLVDSTRGLAVRFVPDPATAFEILSDASGSELPKQ